MKLLNGRAHRAEVYPDEMCLKIFEGLIEQMKRDGRIHSDGIGMVMSEEEAGIDWVRAWDDVTGEELDGDEVIKARATEVGEIRKHTVYQKVQIK